MTEEYQLDEINKNVKQVGLSLLSLTSLAEFEELKQGSSVNQDNVHKALKITKLIYSGDLYTLIIYLLHGNDNDSKLTFSALRKGVIQAAEDLKRRGDAKVNFDEDQSFLRESARNNSVAEKDLNLLNQNISLQNEINQLKNIQQASEQKNVAANIGLNRSHLPYQHSEVKVQRFNSYNPANRSRGTIFGDDLNESRDADILMKSMETQGRLNFSQREKELGTSRILKRLNDQEISSKQISGRFPSPSQQVRSSNRILSSPIVPQNSEKKASTGKLPYLSNTTIAYKQDNLDESRNESILSQILEDKSEYSPRTTSRKKMSPQSNQLKQKNIPLILQESSNQVVQNGYVINRKNTSSSQGMPNSNNSRFGKEQAFQAPPPFSKVTYVASPREVVVSDSLNDSKGNFMRKQTPERQPATSILKQPLTLNTRRTNTTEAARNHNTSLSPLKRVISEPFSAQEFVNYAPVSRELSPIRILASDNQGIRNNPPIRVIDQSHDPGIRLHELRQQISPNHRVLSPVNQSHEITIQPHQKIQTQQRSTKSLTYKFNTISKDYEVHEIDLNDGRTKIITSHTPEMQETLRRLRANLPSDIIRVN